MYLQTILTRERMRNEHVRHRTLTVQVTSTMSDGMLRLNVDRDEQNGKESRRERRKRDLNVF